MKLIPVFFTVPVGVHFKLFLKNQFLLTLFSRDKKVERINLSILLLVEMQPCVSQ